MRVSSLGRVAVPPNCSDPRISGAPGNWEVLMNELAQ
jgi:hypothetical protein